MDREAADAMFRAPATAYDTFMGRYSTPLAPLFADAAGVAAGQTVLDVGCGPGALTGVLVDRLGAQSVAACDPSPPFVSVCAARHPGVDVRQAPAEAIPFEDDRFDAALAQLVLHFVTDSAAAAAGMRRVVRPGGVVAACVWDFGEGMQMLRQFWDAASAVAPDVPDEANVLRFGGEGEIAELFASTGLVGVEETTLRVTSDYEMFDELWDGFLAGVGPAGVYCASLGEAQQAALRQELFERVGSPHGPLTLQAIARCAIGRVPD
jgi:ubiquinone/menaquinone biosynthesis C-methylase UbiE